MKFLKHKQTIRGYRHHIKQFGDLSNSDFVNEASEFKDLFFILAKRRMRKILRLPQEET